MRAHAACRVMLQIRSESDPLEKYEILNGESTVLLTSLMCRCHRNCSVCSSSLPGLPNNTPTARRWGCS